MCLIDGFYITPYHPIYKYNDINKESDILININSLHLEYCDYIYNLHLILEDGTLATYGFLIKGKNQILSAVSLGHLIDNSVFNNLFWKTHIIEIYKNSD